MNSLRLRLSTGLIIGLIIIFITQLVIFSFTIKYLTESFVESRLNHDLESIVTSLNIKDGIPILDTGKVNPTFNRTFSGHYYTVFVNENSLKLQSRSLWNKSLPLYKIETGNYIKQNIDNGPGNQSILLIVRGIKKYSYNLTISVAEDLTPLKNEISSFQKKYILFSFLIFLLLVVLQDKLLKFSFQSINKVKKELKEMEEGDLKQLNENVPIEIIPLVKEFNSLINIIEKRFYHYRNSLSNMAHALKMPLTLISQTINNKSIDKTIKFELDEQIDKMRYLIEKELTSGRIAGSSIGNKKVDLKKELLDLINTLNKIYIGKNIEIEYSIPDNTFFIGDREDLLELFGNLLDNGFKWSNKKLHLKVRNNEKDIYIEIIDDGPGVDNLEMISQRGVRLDENVKGYGFGLAISKEIVDSYSGEIQFENSIDKTGFVVKVRLPKLKIQI